MDSVCRTFAGLLERRRRVLITSYKFHCLLSDVRSLYLIIVASEYFCFIFLIIIILVELISFMKNLYRHFKLCNIPKWEKIP